MYMNTCMCLLQDYERHIHLRYTLSLSEGLNKELIKKPWHHIHVVQILHNILYFVGSFFSGNKHSFTASSIVSYRQIYKTVYCSYDLLFRKHLSTTKISSTRKTEHFVLIEKDLHKGYLWTKGTKTEGAIQPYIAKQRCFLPHLPLLLERL